MFMFMEEFKEHYGLVIVGATILVAQHYWGNEKDGSDAT